MVGLTQGPKHTKHQGQHQGQRKEEDLSVRPKQPEHLFIPRKAKKPKHEFIKFSYDISVDSPSRKLGLPSIGTLEGEQLSNTRAPMPHRKSPPEDFNSSRKAATDAATRTGMYIPTQMELLSIELSYICFDSTRVLVACCLFCILVQYFPCSVSFGCMLGVGVEVWTESILGTFHWGPNSFEQFLGHQIEFGPKWTNIESSLFKPPHRLQVCTKALRNMKSVVCKTTNSWPELRLN